MPESHEKVTPKNCPKCGLINPSVATRCDCGYDFVLQNMQKPYGDRVMPPYRWGVYLGVANGIASLIHLSTAFGAGAFWGPAVSAPWPVSLLFGAASGVAGVGLLRRRRFGVVAFFVYSAGYVIYESVRLASDPNAAKSARLEVLAAYLVSAAVGAWINGIYFKKRWEFLQA
jgi:hypothetical protein